jgi:capsular polysaccharide biosynthesis protein
MVDLSIWDGGYARFEQAVVGPIHSYWREHDEARLGETAQVLSELDARVGGAHIVSATQVVTIIGWLLPRDGYRLRPRELARLNPGYRVRVDRFVRSELGRRARIFRAGFRVIATGAKELAPFRFRISNSHGQALLLPASNSDAQFQATYFPDLVLPSGQAAPSPPQGFVDSAVQTPLGEPRTPETWLAALVHRRPAELLEFVDSPHGQSIAPLVARFANTFPSESRWSDRFALVAFGTSARFTSDLQPASVTRFDAPPPASAAQTLAVPEFSIDGTITRYSAGSAVLPVPDPTWRTFDNVRIQDGGTLLADGSFVVYENSADPRRDFVSGQQYTVFGSRSHPDQALVRLKPAAADGVDEAILLSGRNDANWFHWLIEYLPRVLQVPESIPPTVPLLLSTRTPASGRAALETLTSRPVLTLDPALLHSVRRLHVVAPPVQVFDTTRVPWRDGLSFNPAPLLAMREAWGLGASSDPAGAKIFLSRTSRHRGLTNEHHLAAIAHKHGLTVRDPGGMPFEAQLDLFSHASLVVGASGAVMANYLMMSPGSRVLALTSTALRDFVLPAAIAELAGVEFTYVSGPTERPLSAFPTRNDWLQSDFSVDAKSFEAALVEVIGSRPTRGQTTPGHGSPGHTRLSSSMG